MTSVSLLLTLSTGCLKPYVKRAPSFGPEEEIEALFVSGRVMTREETRDSEGGSWGAIAEAASDIRANSMLDEFAERSLSA